MFKTKSIKRITAVIMLYMMLLNSLSVASAASFADLTNENETRIAEVVSGLNIMDGYAGDDLWYGDKKVTRAEMALYLCRLKGVGDLGSISRETDFSDVESSHWASGYIQTAYELGILEGYKDGTYLPADNIKYEDAVIMLVCALGYKPYALAQGTSPTGYLYTANKIGLTSGVNGTFEQEASRTMVAALIYNSLDIPLMEQILGTDAYGIFDGEDYSPKKTLLSENLGAVKISGFLVNNAISTEYLREDQIQIDIANNYGSRVVYQNTAYFEGNRITAFIGATNAKDLLGRKVEAYLTFETSPSNDPTVLAIFESTNESDKLTIKFDDIISIENVSAAYAMKYWTDKDNSKSDTIYIKKLATYYINSEKAAFTTADLMAAVNSGSFVSSKAYVVIEFSLIGNTTGDYDYDCALISVYENFVVDHVDEVGERVHAGADSTSSLSYIDYAEDAYYLDIVNENGNSVNPVKLKKQDVLTLKVTPYNYSRQEDIIAISAKLSNSSSLTYSSPSFTNETGAVIKNFGGYTIVNANVNVQNNVTCETPQTAYVCAAVYGINNTLIAMKQLDASPISASAEVTISATFTSKELVNAQSIKIIALESGDTLNNLLSSTASISR